MPNTQLLICNTQFMVRYPICNYQHALETPPLLQIQLGFVFPNSQFNRLKQLFLMHINIEKEKSVHIFVSIHLALFFEHFTLTN